VEGATVQTSDTNLPELPVGVVGSRLTQVTPAARAIHQAILRAFATTGHAPDTSALAAATPPGHRLAALLTELHDHDVVRLDHHGQIRAAYPFSAAPTSHLVAIGGGPTVYAMCAIDALGIADMLGRNTTISSTDPISGHEIRVAIGNGRADWTPDTAVVVVGSDTAAASTGGACRRPDDAERAGSVAAADLCCGVMNFFTNPDSARAWITAHPRVAGMVLNQEQALRLGVDIFGRLLDH
jgi:hypothetical protein